VLTLFARRAFLVTGSGLPATLPFGRHLVPNQCDHAHEESDAHNYGRRDRRKILQHIDHLRLVRRG
jgi:hypothetical protein